MTPHLPTQSAPLTPAPRSSAPPATPGKSVPRWVLIVVAVGLLLACSAGAWWWVHHRVRPAFDPPLPKEEMEPEVQAVLEQARDAVLAKPDSGATWGHLGMVLMAHSYPDEAERCFAEAARLAPGSSMWAYGKGLLLLKGQTDKAIPWLRQALENCTGTFDEVAPEYVMTVRLRLAEALLELQQLDEAERLFREEIVRAPQNARAALGMGMVAVARGEDANAQNYLMVARNNPFAQKAVLSQLAILARNRGDAADAAEFERLMTGMPEDQPWPDPFLKEVFRKQVGLDAARKRLEVLERQGNAAEAAKGYLELLKRSPTLPIYIGAGNNLRRSGQFDEAAAILRDAIRAHPKESLPHYTLALTLCSQAEQQQTTLGLTPRLKENLEEAVREARRSAELRPSDARSYMIWGQSLRLLGDLHGAIEPLRRAVACSPSDPRAQLSLGAVLFRTGQQQEAETYLENARKLAPNDSKILKEIERLHREG